MFTPRPETEPAESRRPLESGAQALIEIRRIAILRIEEGIRRIGAGHVGVGARSQPRVHFELDLIVFEPEPFRARPPEEDRSNWGRATHAHLRFPPRDAMVAERIVGSADAHLPETQARLQAAPHLQRLLVARIDRQQALERVARLRRTLQRDQGARPRQQVIRIGRTLSQPSPRQLLGPLGMIRPQLDVDARRAGRRRVWGSR